MVIKVLWAMVYLMIIALFREWKYLLGLVLLVLVLWFISVFGLIALSVIGG